ncbi:uncharacterized protein LOC107464193 [Arachis duranensis]|uniref:Uncharacterized protein LOC107464193 n=1 Tax=Arachis duranensis TaxID=130453 RepID=A0A9C6WD33_ARADU|nr:uncharacterized protein LOC107464193 [Arachis duranensis]
MKKWTEYLFCQKLYFMTFLQGCCQMNGETHAYNRKNPFGDIEFVESLFLHGLQKLKEADIQGIQEFMYELLMDRKKQELFDYFGDTKRWWHDLKIVKVTYSFNVDESVDFKTTLNALLLPLADPESVSFSLEL